MRVLGIITARGSSKGIPRKNVRLVCGHPLIAYTIDAAKRSKRLTRVVVSTDDVEIADIAKSYGAEVPFLRPAELASDKAPHLPVLLHALDFVHGEGDELYNAVFILQPTAPLREPSDIDGSIDKCMTTGADSVIGLVKVEAHHPYLMKRIVDDRIVPFSHSEPEGTRRQDYRPEAFMRSGSVYVIRTQTLTQHKSLFGLASHPWLMPAEKGINVDTEADIHSLVHFLPRFFNHMIKSEGPTKQ